MLRDFERLYLWRRRRRFLAPKDILIVLPKEVDILTLKSYYLERTGSFQFPDFIKYIEWFGGRRADMSDEVEVIDLADVRDYDAAVKNWIERGVDTKKIGLKEFRPIEDEIRENEERARR